MANATDQQYESIEDLQLPPSLISPECEAISPQMLPLLDLEPEEIERIARAVPGGARNIEDIYPLAPPQEGILFHHLLKEQGVDAFVLMMLLSFSSKDSLEVFIRALQKVVNHHPILRTAVLWERVPRPVQVVYRQAILPVMEMVLDRGRDPLDQIREYMRPEWRRLNPREAPQMRLQVAPDSNGNEWYALLQVHQLVCDYDSLEIMIREVIADFDSRMQQPVELVPYRDYVARVLANARMYDAEAFFKKKLSDIDEPTVPFGLSDVLAGRGQLDEVREMLEPGLAKRIRAQALHLSVSIATMFHAAWALVIARTSGRDDVTYGTVLPDRPLGGGKQIVGMATNTLPLRLRLRGVTCQELAWRAQQELSELMSHRHATLSVAQQCRGLDESHFLFSALLSYRHCEHDLKVELRGVDGVTILAARVGSSYPLMLLVDELSEGFALTAQTDWRIASNRVIGYINTAMRSLMDALEEAPQTPALSLPIMPESEWHQVIVSFNPPSTTYPQNHLIHEIFEEQVERTPEAVAVVYEGQTLTYAELNTRANQLARRLRDRGVGADQRVGICLERSLEWVVGWLGALKAGGAYVPLDPSYPAERLRYMMEDAAPRVLLTQGRLRARLPPTQVQVIALDEDFGAMVDEGECNLSRNSLQPTHLAYVIYTSGSTGAPKGVMVEHRNVVNLIHWYCKEFQLRQGERCGCVAAVGFDAAGFEVWPGLSVGATLVLASSQVGRDVERLVSWWAAQELHVSFLPTPIAEWAFSRQQYPRNLRILLVGGDRLHSCPVGARFRLVNNYGPTESTVVASAGEMSTEDLHIGRPIANTQIYILDSLLQPVPIGVAGELYIGGAGVARGYLNREELTRDRFVRDPFSAAAQGRMYKSGDVGRWRADGTIEYLGRNDQQVKIRGHRIELGEIEAQLLQHSQIKEVIVLAREDKPGEKRLVAYVVADSSSPEVSHLERTAKAGANMVKQRRTPYEETDSTGPAAPSFVGWNSSYTDQPIPELEMHEWLASTLESIQSLQPKKVLEIGCGTGLLLQHVAPRCATYFATDVSTTTLEHLRQWIRGQPALQHVQLLDREASDLQDLPAGAFDTVVLHSVVQHFPNIEYLVAVLQEATRLLGPGGKIFVGDVRHLGLLPMFHSAVQLDKAVGSLSVERLKRRISQAVAEERELVIDPRFFEALCQRLPRLSVADVQLKRGLGTNELTRYRYNVVLGTDEEKDTSEVWETLEWPTDVQTVAQMESALREHRWGGVRLCSVPNQRLARDAAAQRLIETSEEQLEASTLRHQLSQLQFDAVDPETFWELAQSHGYGVQVRWDIGGPLGSAEVRLLDHARSNQIPRVPSKQQEAMKPWVAYANDPSESSFRRKLITQLRDHLKGRLPDYMIPSAWVVLKQLPLTMNGKVDRRALPVPQNRPEELNEYVAPRTDLEMVLAEAWTQALQVDRVGVRDNFFELGGHSVAALRLAARIRSTLGRDFEVRTILECPTVEALALSLSGQEQNQVELEEGTI